MIRSLTFARRAAIFQVVAVAGALTLVALIVATTIGNLQSRGIPFGFDFLSGRAGFTISESLLAYEPDDSIVWAIVVGIGNTLFVSAIAIVISTLLGTLLGIARLSDNPLVAALARVWIEAARNTPLLLLLLFLYTIWWTLPADTGREVIPGVHMSMRGIAIPWISLPFSASLIVLGLLSAAALLIIASRLAAIRQARTGRRPPYVAAATGGIVIIVALATLVSGRGVAIDWPVATPRGPAGGLALTPETATILLGLIFYTTGFIAEIVRGGINAVPTGQWEAARAVGLSARKILRLVIIPQMMRVIVPPMTSQYINVVKNSTLALAIGYSDFMVVMGTVINKTSHAIEGTVVIILVYLGINLSLSAVLNAYNRRVALKER